MSFVSSSVSSRTMKIRSLSIQWILWNLSMHRTILDLHLRLSSHQYASPSIHPVMCENLCKLRALYWNRKWFFFRHVLFDSWFHVMAVFEISWHGPKIIYRFTGIRKWVLRWWKRPFSSNCVFPYQSGCSLFLISSRKMDSSICGWKINFPIFGEILLPLHWVFLSRFLMRQSFTTAQCLRPVRHTSKFSSRTLRIRVTIQVRLSFQIDGFLTGLPENRVILNQWSKRNDSSIKKVLPKVFPKEFPIRQEILNVSHIGITFHEIPPLLPTPDCNSTADVPPSTLRTAFSAIPFVSDLCGVDVQWF